MQLNSASYADFITIDILLTNTYRGYCICQTVAMPFYTYLFRGMQMAGKISDENLVSNVAKKPLPMFKYPVKKRPTFDCDIISTCMLPSDVSEDYCVAYTKRDGSCLYTAFSRHLSGGYSFANELRCRVAYELVIQNQMYCDAAKECLYYDQPSQEYITNVATGQFQQCGGSYGCCQCVRNHNHLPLS